LRYVYWILAVPTALAACLVILLTVAGENLSRSTPWWVSLAASSGVLALLWWGHVLATRKGRPGAGSLLVAASWLFFFAVVLVNGLLRQRTWQ
jgi:arginine exporter protein ArgO